MAKKRNQMLFGGVPRADLLPMRQRAELVHERTMPKLLLAIVASAVVAGLLFLLGTLPVFLVNERLAEAEQESTALLEELASHSETQNFKQNSEAIAAQIVPLTQHEVHFSSEFAKVQSVLPEGASLAGLRGELTVDAAAETSLCAPGTALITLTVLAPTLVTTADLISALQEVEGSTCAEAIHVVEASEGMNSSTVLLVLDDSVKVQRFSDGGQS